MKIKTQLFSIHILLLISLSHACQNTERAEGNEPVKMKSDTVRIIIPAKNAIRSSAVFDTVFTNSQYMLLGSTGADQWLEFQLPVKVPGRYRSEIIAASTTTAAMWIEDYVGNEDDRTYNVTGDVVIQNSAGSLDVNSFYRDGSPFNIGTHVIRLHFKSRGTFVQALNFTLIKEHKETPVLFTQRIEGSKWQLVWSDEFDGAGLPDTSKWTYDIGDWGWGNNELQYYTKSRMENARQENGILIIEARKNDAGHAWTSARLTTRGKESFKYGKIEIRAKVPAERGNWSAGWLLGDAYVDEKSWPYCGEIDVLECVGYEMQNGGRDGVAHASVHCGAYYFKLGNQPTATLNVKNMTEAFHTYTLEWTPDYIKIFLDGEKYFEYHDTSTHLTWPFDQPQNIILNLAMGGGWGGAKGLDNNVNTQQLFIDYVRVFELI